MNPRFLEKTKKLFWSLISVAFLLPYIVLSATGGTGDTEGMGITNPLKVKNLYEFVREALAVVRDIGILVAVFFIVYSGFLFVTARGSDEGLKKAKRVLLWTVVGTAVLLGAWLFATVIEGTINQLRA